VGCRVANTDTSLVSHVLSGFRSMSRDLNLGVPPFGRPKQEEVVNVHSFPIAPSRQRTRQTYISFLSLSKVRKIDVFSPISMLHASQVTCREGADTVGLVRQCGSGPAFSSHLSPGPFFHSKRSSHRAPSQQLPSRTPTKCIPFRNLMILLHHH